MIVILPPPPSLCSWVVSVRMSMLNVYLVSKAFYPPEKHHARIHSIWIDKFATAQQTRIAHLNGLLSIAPYLMIFPLQNDSHKNTHTHHSQFTWIDTESRARAWTNEGERKGWPELSKSQKYMQYEYRIRIISSGNINIYKSVKYM